jgi:tRNA-specific 2-thiouridylase
MKEKVAVAFSGGVDSSYTAWLLMRQGYEVEGVCLDLFASSRAPAEAVEAGQWLGISVHVVERRELFQEAVVDYFCRTYHAGLTPNPCAICNPAIKFALLLEVAKGLGAAKVATGHYARCIYDRPSGLYQLLRGKDGKKDQSYFLYRLGQDSLSKVLFPLGELTKEEVRAEAAKAGLPPAAKRDSQEVCFIPDGDYQSFLRGQPGGAEGECSGAA